MSSRRASGGYASVAPTTAPSGSDLRSRRSRGLEGSVSHRRFETRCLADGREVAPAVRADDPDLILLDLVLPGRDGITVCRELRAFTDTPVIIVTGRVDEIDRLVGLELDADDYICSHSARVSWSLASTRSCGGLAAEKRQHRMRVSSSTAKATRQRSTGSRCH